MTPSPTTTVLYVEDDPVLSERVKEYLEGLGFRVEIEPNGDAAVDRIQHLAPDVVVLDVLLPGLDGLSICRAVRSSGFQGPVLMLTALEDEADEVAGLEVGADDYLTKPFRLRILLARIRALMRRGAPAGSGLGGREGTPLTVGGLLIIPAQRFVALNGTPVPLTTMEFDVLRRLAESAGTPVTRNDLSLRARGIPWDGADRSIDGAIQKIRTKLGDDGSSPTLVKSVRGVGYLLAQHD